MFRKLSAIFFAMLLLSSTNGVILYYWAQIEGCKIQAWRFRNTTEKDFRITRKFSSNQEGVELLSRNEIRYQGKKFDITKVTIENGIKFYYAYSDIKEDKLTEDLAAVGKNNTTNKTAAIRNSFRVNIFWIKEYKPVDRNFFGIEKKFLSNYFINNYQSPLLKVAAPPPKLFTC